MAFGFRARFIPSNPEKYVGKNINDIWARSSWEVSAMKFFDQSPSVLKWGSEEIAIPYLKPSFEPGVLPSVHQYYPDFIVMYQDRAGNIHREIIEIKPLKEALEEKAASVYDKMALAVNKAKWAAATRFAQQHGMTFKVVTEQSLFFQGYQSHSKPKKTAKKAKRPTGSVGTVKPRKSRGTKK